MIDEKVMITEGEYEGKTGKITNVYHGWMFDQYTILLDEDGSSIDAYHNEIKLI